jgi:hypothetical protein
VKLAFGGIKGTSKFANSDEGEISMRTAVRQAGFLTTLKVSPRLEKLTNEKHIESATAKHHATASIVRSRLRV